MRLRLAPVEYKRCPACETEYEGGQCPRDKTVFDETTTQKVDRERLILVGKYPEVYVPASRFRCSNKGCGNLYAALQCPRCGAPKPQRPTTVWTRTFAVTESLEELQRRELRAGEEDQAETEAEEMNHDEEEHNE